MTTYGLTPQGFVIPRESDIVAAIASAMTDAFGATTNTAPETVLGQLAGILGEREALLWEAMDDLVVNVTPAGAEGVFVDNLLAYSGLKRLPALATVTSPTPSVQADGTILYGLVLYGTPGTVIPAGSIVQTSTLPPVNFTLDSSVTISPSTNALQRLFANSTPTAGAYQLALVAPSGATLTTAAIPFNALPAAAQVTFAQQPTVGTFVLSLGPVGTAPLPYTVTASQMQAAIQALDGFAGAGVTGSMQNGFVITTAAGAVPYIAVNSNSITFGSTSTSGTFTLTLGNAVTTPLAFNCAAIDVQNAVRALVGYSQVGVTGSITNGFTIHWGNVTPPTLTVTNDSTTLAPAVKKTMTLDAPAVAVNSVQAAINSLVDGDGSLPFTDVAVTSPTTLQLAIAYGQNTPAQGQAASGAKAQPQIQVASNTLNVGGKQTNLAVVIGVLGSPSQGVGSATCTSTGPNAVTANQLTVIGSGQVGWSSVNNQIDCITGRDLESDTEALQRRAAQLQAKGNGPLASVVDQVQQVAGVTAAIGFANNTAAALQRLTFATVPTSGTYMLGYRGDTTAALPYNASASDVQAALVQLPYLSSVLVAGSAQYGFQIDFNGAQGGQAQDLLLVVQDTTGAQLTATYGRAPKSLELVVEGGSDSDVAQAILSSVAGGIATYGAPELVTLGSPTQGSTILPLASVQGLEPGLALFGAGIPAQAIVLSVTGNNVQMSLPANSTASQTAIIANHTAFLTDAAGNPQQVSWSRPLSTIIFVSVRLVTDLYRTPGDPTSGANPTSQFNPASVATIQQNIIALGNAVPIGGTIVAKGTNGLVGAFNQIPGVVDYDLYFDTSSPPINTQNIALQAEQVPSLQSYNVDVSYE